MRGKKANRICVEKILKYCDEISTMYHNHNEDQAYFASSMELQYACGMCIVQIGELVSRLDDDYISAHSNIPWRRLKGLRNIYAHDYDRIDTDMILETITEDLPKIRAKLANILATSEETDSGI